MALKGSFLTPPKSQYDKTDTQPLKKIVRNHLKEIHHTTMWLLNTLILALQDASNMSMDVNAQRHRMNKVANWMTSIQSLKFSFDRVVTTRTTME